MIQIYACGQTDNSGVYIAEHEGKFIAFPNPKIIGSPVQHLLSGNSDLHSISNEHNPVINSLPSPEDVTSSEIAQHPHGQSTLYARIHDELFSCHENEKNKSVMVNSDGGLCPFKGFHHHVEDVEIGYIKSNEISQEEDDPSLDLGALLSLFRNTMADINGPSYSQTDVRVVMLLTAFATAGILVGIIIIFLLVRKHKRMNVVQSKDSERSENKVTDAQETPIPDAEEKADDENQTAQSKVPSVHFFLGHGYQGITVFLKRKRSKGKRVRSSPNGLSAKGQEQNSSDDSDAEAGDVPEEEQQKPKNANQVQKKSKIPKAQSLPAIVSTGKIKIGQLGSISLNPIFFPQILIV